MENMSLDLVKGDKRGKRGRKGDRMNERRVRSNDEVFAIGIEE